MEVRIVGPWIQYQEKRFNQFQWLKAEMSATEAVSVQKGVVQNLYVYVY